MSKQGSKRTAWVPQWGQTVFDRKKLCIHSRCELSFRILMQEAMNMSRLSRGVIACLIATASLQRQPNVGGQSQHSYKYACM